MTRDASEIFALQLARASAKTAQRFLAVRGLQTSDRDDVIAAAMLWCWKNRDQYSLTTTLETWFMNAVRNAYQTLQRGELPTSVESIEQLGGGDETYARAAATDAARALIEALTPDHKVVAMLSMEGLTRREIMERAGLSKRTVDEAHQRIKQLRRLLPKVPPATFFARTAPSAPSDEAADQLSSIDMALAQLDFAPLAGKDCPPCWRCKWYEGLLPDGKRSTRMEIEDVEVREAVKNTEARKIEIAQQVRAGV